MNNPFSGFPDWLSSDDWKLYEHARVETLETIRDYLASAIAKQENESANGLGAESTWNLASKSTLLDLHEFIFGWRPGSSQCVCSECDRLATTMFAACKPCTDAGCDLGEGTHPE